MQRKGPKARKVNQAEVPEEKSAEIVNAMTPTVEIRLAATRALGLLAHAWPAQSLSEIEAYLLGLLQSPAATQRQLACLIVADAQEVRWTRSVVIV